MLTIKDHEGSIKRHFGHFGGPGKPESVGLREQSSKLSKSPKSVLGFIEFKGLRFTGFKV